MMQCGEDLFGPVRIALCHQPDLRVCAWTTMQGTKEAVRGLVVLRAVIMAPW